MKRNLYIPALALALSGCISQSDIQAKYVRKQDECRNVIRASLASAASSNAANTPSPGATVADPQTTIAAQFSECMNKAGWHVPLPKTGPTPPTQVVQNPPTGSPSTNPHAALSVAPPSQTATVQTPVQNPPAGAPSTNPSAAAARVAQPSPSGGTPNLPGGAASTNPSAAIPSANIPKPAVASTSPVTGKTTISPATYQPARPVGTPAINYGSGAGRQF